MNKNITLSTKELDKYRVYPATNNVFQLVGSLIDGVKETNESRKKLIREVIIDSMDFRINLFEKLSLHFSKEAMLMERNRANFISLFDMVTFSKSLSKYKN